MKKLLIKDIHKILECYTYFLPSTEAGLIGPNKSIYENSYSDLEVETIFYFKRCFVIIIFSFGCDSQRASDWNFKLENHLTSLSFFL
jgi:hypothetical protein